MTGLCAAHNPFTHLVVVCGHGTYRGHGDPRQESSWILERFRQSNDATGKPSEHHTFVQHILAGSEILGYDSGALLVFSGGCTQKEIALTEAESYREAFDKLVGRDSSHRTAVETLATDSFQNLLFSILVFRQHAGLYPRQVTVITHAFKERRFLECHGPAIRWPSACLRTVGIDPAFTQQELDLVKNGEYENALKHFITDPYAAKPPLNEKRRLRNWDETAFEHMIQARYLDQDVKALLTWTGGIQGNEIYPGPLPWAK